jgi:hypothetical protein
MLQELRLIKDCQPTTSVNLYKAGGIDLVTPLLQALHLRVLRRGLSTKKRSNASRARPRQRWRYFL